MACFVSRGVVFALIPGVALIACDPVVDDESLDDDATEAADDAEGSSDPEPDEVDETQDEPQPQPQPRPATADPCDWDAPWGGYECTTDAGEDGRNYCIRVDGEEIWTDCATQSPACEPGEGYDMGCEGSLCTWDGEALRIYSWSEPDCATPLVLAFEDAPLEFAPASAAAFDLSSDGTCMSTDWPMAPWLALDRDGDGFIRDGSELFGSATRMSVGGHAPHGFAALAELDTDGDGKITAADARFHELVLWTDLDGDRVGAYDELRPLAELSIVSIDLGFERTARCDRYGNCGLERATFEYRTSEGELASGQVVDVHLACQ
jgi:hypothetical protein